MRLCSSDVVKSEEYREDEKSERGKRGRLRGTENSGSGREGRRKRERGREGGGRGEG